jgi:hypothetical protein
MRLGDGVVDVLTALAPALVVLFVLLVMLLCVRAGALSGAFAQSGARLHRSGAVFARRQAWRRWTMGKYLVCAEEMLRLGWRLSTDVVSSRLRAVRLYAGSF